MGFRRLRRPEAAFFSMTLPIRGRSLIVNNGAEMNLQPEYVYLIDSSRPTLFLADESRANGAGATSAYETLNIQVPIHFLRERLGPHGSGKPLKLPSQSASAAILRQFVTAFYDESFVLDEQSASFFEQQICDIAAFCFASPSGAFSEDSLVLAAHRERIARWIERHYADDRLSPELIAAGCGISSSYLHRCYKNTGLTLMEHVQKIRLEAADAALRQHHASNISQIAYSAGFKSLSNFSRSYKRQFGLSPTQARSR
jgi:AraC-like DNA-binding protein